MLNFLKDEEFRVSDKDTSDDEETIQEQEKAEGKVDHKKELDDLKVRPLKDICSFIYSKASPSRLFL